MNAYDAVSKQTTRDEMWAVLGKKPGIALIMPGPRRHEFDTAVKYGVHPEQLLLVESNPATKANFTRQFNHQERPQLQWQRGSLTQVCSALVKRGKRIQIAHLDFCKPLGFLNSNSPAVEIERFIKSNILIDGFLAVTVLGGREQDGTDSDSTRYNRLDRAVQMRLVIGTPRSMVVVSRGKYFNEVTHNPMIWTIYNITTTN